MDTRGEPEREGEYLTLIVGERNNFIKIFNKHK